MKWVEGIKDGLKITLMLAGVLALVGIYQLTEAGRQLVSRVDAQVARNANKVATIITDAQLTLRDVKVAAKATRDEWESPDYQRGRKRYVQLSDQVAILLARLDMETLPEMTGLLKDLRRDSDSVRVLVDGLNTRINDELLTEATKAVVNLSEVAVGLKLTADETNKAIVRIANEGGMTLGDIRSILTMNEIRDAIKNIEMTTRSVDGTARNVEQASAQLPSIAASVERIAQTSSRYQKALLFVQLLATVARALL